MPRNVRPTIPPSERVTLAVTRVQGRESVAYCLSTVRTQGRRNRSEILENGSFHVAGEEARLWTPAELLVVASAHLPCPGDDVWFTESMF